MDFGLSTEQDILKRSAREFLATEFPFELAKDMMTDERGCPPDLWQKMADLGWTALPIPDQYGGAGGSIQDLAVLLEEMGRANGPNLFFTAVVLGGLTILEAGSEEQKSELLPAIAAGELIATLAVLEPGLSYEPSAIHTTASANSSGYKINGTKLFVPDVHLASHIICAARTADRTASSEGVSLLLVPTSDGKAPGVSTTRLNTMAGDKQFEVTFDQAPATALGTANESWPALRRVLEIAAVAKCAELVGATQRVLDLSVEQGHNRSQFGRPVGSFQAIQHHCANILMGLDLSRFFTYQAAWLISEGQPCAKQVSMAKAFVGDAYLRAVTLGHEILGGNGLIEEHEMPLFSKRALAGQELFGSPDYHRELIVRALGV